MVLTIIYFEFKPSDVFVWYKVRIRVYVFPYVNPVVLASFIKKTTFFSLKLSWHLCQKPVNHTYVTTHI